MSKRTTDTVQKLREEGKTIPQWAKEHGFPVRAVRAVVYSPTSKGSIEGLFNILEQVFKGLPGWIGGRRDNMKTANKGQTVAPYARRSATRCALATLPWP